MGFSGKIQAYLQLLLAERKIDWQQNQKIPKSKKRSLTYYDQSNWLTELKKKYPEYIWMYLKVLQHTLKKLDFAFQPYFSK